MKKEFDINANAKIVFGGKSWNSEDIKSEINRIASHINSNNAKPVGIMLSRGYCMIPALLSCLKCHRPYVPISINNPVERINQIIYDSGMNFVITEKRYLHLFANIDTFLVDSGNNGEGKYLQSKDCKNNNDIAYILYTSGSTGEPKGVEIYRQSLFNLIEGIQDVLQFKKTDRIACLTTYSFDIFFVESILALELGMTVVLADETISGSHKKLCQWLDENDINVIQMTPSRLIQLLYVDADLKCLSKINKIMVGGEPLQEHLLKKLQICTDARIFNMYGPTETTVWSSIGELTESEYVHIGQPIKNTKFYILSDNLEECEDGEIYISGEGLAKGYLNRESLNKSAFLRLNDGTRIYRTGDMGNQSPDGKYFCKGRKDKQVKIHGCRIELGEIETLILRYPSVKNAVAMCNDTECIKEIYVFYVSDDNIDEKELNSYLYTKLPEYMIPKKCIRLNEIPLTTNEKVNAEKLKNDILKNMKEKVNTTEGDNLCSQKVLNVISKYAELKIEEDSSLFELGIDSLSFIKMIVEIEETFSFEFDDEMLVTVKYNNVRDFVDYVLCKISENYI